MKRLAKPSGLLSAYLMLHLGMVIYDLNHQEISLRADRANERIALIGDFLRLDELPAQLDFIGQHNVPGDYLVQALLYGLGGLPLLLVVQVAVAVLSVVCVYRIACTVLEERRLSLLVASAYGLLPQTLIFPHQLSAEAWFAPLIVFGFHYMVRWIDNNGSVASSLSGLYWAGATLTRATVLPFAFLSAVVLRSQTSRNGLAPFYLALLVPVAAWLMTVHSYTGQWSFGVKTNATVGFNLLLRAEDMIDTLPPESRERAREDYTVPARNHGGMTTSRYLAYCVEFWRPCVASVGRDAVNFFAKSGVERITLDYLGLVSEEEMHELWADAPGKRAYKDVLRQEGLVATAKIYLRKYPTVAAISIFCAIAYSALTFLYFVGALHCLVNLIKTGVRENRHVMLAVLAIFPPYLFLVTSVVGNMQARHRAGAEFAVIVLAAHGWRALAKLMASLRDQRESAAR